MRNLMEPTYKMFGDPPYIEWVLKIKWGGPGVYYSDSPAEVGGTYLIIPRDRADATFWSCDSPSHEIFDVYVFSNHDVAHHINMLAQAPSRKLQKTDGTEV